MNCCFCCCLKSCCFCCCNCGRHVQQTYGLRLKFRLPILKDRDTRTAKVMFLKSLAFLTNACCVVLQVALKVLRHQQNDPDKFPLVSFVHANENVCISKALLWNEKKNTQRVELSKTELADENEDIFYKYKKTKDNLKELLEGSCLAICGHSKRSIGFHIRSNVSPFGFIVYGATRRNDRQKKKLMCAPVWSWVPDSSRNFKVIWEFINFSLGECSKLNMTISCIPATIPKCAFE